MWYCDSAAVKDDRGGAIRVKRIETVLRGRLRDLGRILASLRILQSRNGCITRDV